MRMLAVALPIAAALAVPAGAQQAAQAPANQPDITVTGDDRIVCRYVTRTATRMRRGRVCRKLSEWQGDSDRAARAAYNPNETIDGAADTLQVLNGDEVELNPTTSGPLGPR